MRGSRAWEENQMLKWVLGVFKAAAMLLLILDDLYLAVILIILLLEVE